MEVNVLAGLEPQVVFSQFEKLCAIPRGSGKTKKISDYFVSFAKKNNLRYIQDVSDNVILFKEASTGYEDHPPLILQAHMDMVCRKEEGCTKNMAKDPLDLAHDGEFIFAKGTSLGGDDGIGVALALAVLADDSIAHPPLEVIFTSDEEIGMLGAHAIDVSMLRGRRLWNLDTLRDTSITAGCAGSARVTMSLDLFHMSYEAPLFCIEMTGLHGGHSGGLIKMNYANAIKAMAELLDRLEPLALVSLSGGGATNAIPDSCSASFTTMMELGELQSICDQYANELMSAYDEPGLKIEVISKGQQMLYSISAERSAQIIAFLKALPNGVLSWWPGMDHTPLTSVNIGIAEFGFSFSVTAQIRSNVNAERDMVMEQLRQLCDTFDIYYETYGVYSAWEYREDSEFRKRMVDVYQRHYGAAPNVKVSHAGLECGVFCEKLPELDCVSAGPSVMKLHTSNEVLSIDSVKRFWPFMLEVLKAL